MQNKLILTSVSFVVVLGFWFLAQQNEYIEFNFASLQQDSKQISIVASIHGSHDHSEGVIITQSPYYIKFAVSDKRSVYDSFNISSVDLTSRDTREKAELKDKFDNVKFEHSQLHNGAFAAIVIEDLLLLSEDYRIQCTLVLCKKNGQCENIALDGIFELQINKYKTNAFFDALLSV